jgi:hypothetical protein
MYRADGVYDFFADLAEPRFEAYFPGVSQWSLFFGALWRTLLSLGTAIGSIIALLLVR